MHDEENTYEFNCRLWSVGTSGTPLHLFCNLREDLKKGGIFTLKGNNTFQFKSKTFNIKLETTLKIDKKNDIIPFLYEIHQQNSPYYYLAFYIYSYSNQPLFLIKDAESNDVTKIFPLKLAKLKIKKI